MGNRKKTGGDEEAEPERKLMRRAQSECKDLKRHKITF